MGCIYMSLNSSVTAHNVAAVHMVSQGPSATHLYGYQPLMQVQMWVSSTYDKKTYLYFFYALQSCPPDCWVSALGFLDPLDCPEKLQAGTKSLIPSRRICSHSLHSGHHDNCIKRGEMKAKWWIQWTLIVDIRKKKLYNPVALHSLCGVCGK
jgi:hypothetical protein